MSEQTGGAKIDEIHTLATNGFTHLMGDELLPTAQVAKELVKDIKGNPDSRVNALATQLNKDADKLIEILGGPAVPSSGLFSGFFGSKTATPSPAPAPAPSPPSITPPASGSPAPPNSKSSLNRGSLFTRKNRSTGRPENLSLSSPASTKTQSMGNWLRKTMRRGKINKLTTPRDPALNMPKPGAPQTLTIARPVEEKNRPVSSVIGVSPLEKGQGSRQLLPRPNPSDIELAPLPTASKQNVRSVTGISELGPRQLGSRQLLPTASKQNVRSVTGISELGPRQLGSRQLPGLPPSDNLGSINPSEFSSSPSGNFASMIFSNKPEEAKKFREKLREGTKEVQPVSPSVPKRNTNVPLRAPKKIGPKKFAPPPSTLPVVPSSAASSKPTGPPGQVSSVKKEVARINNMTARTIQVPTTPYGPVYGISGVQQYTKPKGGARNTRKYSKKQAHRQTRRG